VQHYTDKEGFNGIASQPAWVFLARRPPGDHPVGAYFTSLGPETRHLAKRLRIPRSKLAYRFEVDGAGDLVPLPGGRGAYISYSPVDYTVERPRQVFHGSTGL